MDNKSLGRFDLTDIPPAPRGVPQIEVTFDIDANGILNVSAKDKGTGKEQNIVIKASSGLSDDEVDRMVKDAEAHADEDRKFHALADARNQADNMIHATEKSLKELGEDKVSADEKKDIEQAIEDLTSPDCPEDRAEKLFQYIESAFSHIEASNEDAAENLSVTSKQALPARWLRTGYSANHTTLTIWRGSLGRFCLTAALPPRIATRRPTRHRPLPTRI